MLLFSIYSTLAVTWFQSRTISFSDFVHLRLGITLQRDGRHLLKIAWAD
jgi:D-arabinose 5-phosphate isomerase GutQ